MIFDLTEISHKDRPQFEQDPVEIEVPENARLGNTVHQIKPISTASPGGEKGIENGAGNLVFAMLDQLPNEAFNIEPSSGKIKLTKQLDYETDKNFILTVRVTESRSQLSTFVTVIGKGNRNVFSNHQIALMSIFKNLVKWQQDLKISSKRQQDF